jgi:hypothetical protein
MPWGALVVLSSMSGCHRSVAIPARAAAQPTDVGAPRVDSPPPAPSQPAVVLRPFAWEHVRVLGNDAKLDGPGLAAEAKPGDRVALLAPNGTTRVTAIDMVDHASCEGDKACSGVWIATGDEDDEPAPIWTFPGLRDAKDDDAGPEDIALVETTLAVTGDMALPKLVPHALEVRYFNALCEGDADGDDFVLLARVTSKTPHPLAGVSALTAFRGKPQRVVTLRSLARSIHFVSIADVDMPKRRRMSDVSSGRRETLFILEGDGEAARVVHTESAVVHRSTNHDFACQLPVSHPIPWSVVSVEGEAFVLTRSGFDAYDRWSLGGSDLRRAGEWTADVLELF